MRASIDFSLQYARSGLTLAAARVSFRQGHAFSVCDKTCSQVVFALALCLLGGTVARAQPSQEQLTINVLQGDRGVHLPGEDTSKPPSSKRSSGPVGRIIEVEVRTATGAIQPAADVKFLPPNVPRKPNILYLNGQPITPEPLKTDALGTKKIEVKGNGITGLVPIIVTASFEGRNGRTTLNQINKGRPFWTKRKIAIFSSILAGTGIILWEVFKPGPPSGTAGAAIGGVGPPPH